MIWVNTTSTEEFLSKKKKKKEFLPTDIMEASPLCFGDQKSSKGQLKDFLHSEAYFLNFDFLEIRMCFIIAVYKCSIQMWCLFFSSHVKLLLNQGSVIQFIAS